MTSGGRGPSAQTLISRGRSSWRGRAVEPVIREALSLASEDLLWPEAVAVGGWWNRAFDPEIDLVGCRPASIGVSRAGFTSPAASGLQLVWTPEDVVQAFT